ncbi:hypothetical protein EDEG_01121 [Edhazardia aedis USNM 41457]|uniref:Uncharacterized protein n=1 Tax=Edhazardia aedis (strain USNM 41457) TaxID=1003232 RepID=J8ZYE8_EDHAE|nr:hypothetical protein EDEG_01121 [Edhazardia aedis USNM 41457]|eukprot:EJW04673.1 hypothetical protein EDEG_01121 [Edhazardia aedis USNM 41457]
MKEVSYQIDKNLKDISENSKIYKKQKNINHFLFQIMCNNGLTIHDILDSKFDISVEVFRENKDSDEKIENYNLGTKKFEFQIDYGYTTNSVSEYSVHIKKTVQFLLLHNINQANKKKNCFPFSLETTHVKKLKIIMVFTRLLQIYLVDFVSDEVGDGFNYFGFFCLHKNLDLSKKFGITLRKKIRHMKGMITIKKINRV